MSSSDPTLMFSEARSAGSLVAAQRERNRAGLEKLGLAFAANRPRTILTLARGSSDNAATFARYLIERRLGIVTGSLAPSVNSVYLAEIDFSDTWLIAVSQSGRSPDIIDAARRARERGARIIALVNDPASPLADQADFLLEIGAGPELSVAATKSFILSITALLDLLRVLDQEASMQEMLGVLPELLDEAWEADWTPALSVLVAANNLFVVARGHAFGIAQELALKLKETCAIHAEAISSAEVRHGPMTLVREGFPVILLGQDDETRAGIAELGGEFVKRSATVIHSGLSIEGGIALPAIASHPVIAPLLQLQSFYRLCENLSRLRGLDPDKPPFLNKVTRTL